MARALVMYYSRSGNTKKMAQAISQAVQKGGVESVCKDVGDVACDELHGFDTIVVGSPTYYGTMAWEIKKIFDETVKFHGRLDGKIGAAFASSANIGGGNETTILDILNAMLIHGMIIQGDPVGDHYGPVSINEPDERVKKMCARFGTRIADLTKKLHG